MISLIVQAVLGICSVALIVASNPRIFRRPSVGPLLSMTEYAYYAAGIASVAIGWYFRFRFATEYSTGSGNPGTGPVGYLSSLFVNPAASSVSQDYLLAKVVVLPLFTVIGGFQHGVRRPWLYFVSSLFTSFTFALAFYLATRERQRRLAGSIRIDAAPPPVAGL